MNATLCHRPHTWLPLIALLSSSAFMPLTSRAAAPTGSPAATTPAQADNAATTHRAAAGDTYNLSIFELIVPGQTYYDQQKVDARGQIHLPSVGDVDVAGLTTTQMQEKIGDMLTTTVGLGVRHVAPEVTVTWLQQGELHLAAVPVPPAATGSPRAEEDPMIQALRSEQAQWIQQKIKEANQIVPGGPGNLDDTDSHLKAISEQLAIELAARAEEDSITLKLETEHVDVLQDKVVEEAKISPSPAKIQELTTRLKTIDEEIGDERQRLHQRREDAAESAAREAQAHPTITTTYDARAAAGIPPGVSGPLTADQRAAVRDVVEALRQFAQPGETIAAVNGLVIVGATAEGQTRIKALLDQLQNRQQQIQEQAQTYQKAHEAR